MAVAERFGLEEIRRFWTDQALRHGSSPAASWSDLPVLDLEVREIARHLADGQRVLDVGCANGHSTVRLAASHDLSVRGLDVIPEMIAQARQRLASLPAELARRVAFDVGDVTALDEPPESYDRVVVIRVLINLETWERQAAALGQCARVLRPGGLLLLSEATRQGWTALNRFRREWGLPDIPMPAFNNYVDQELLVAAASPDWDVVEVSDFASSYYVATRVVKPLLARAAPVAVDVANPLMEWNRWASLLPAAGDYGTQKLFVLRKR
jgi:ubiquinone/menaquinone biosynthesis C-methylase UbiE